MLNLIAEDNDNARYPKNEFTTKIFSCWEGKRRWAEKAGKNIEKRLQRTQQYDLGHINAAGEWFLHRPPPALGNTSFFERNHRLENPKIKIHVSN